MNPTTNHTETTDETTGEATESVTEAADIVLFGRHVPYGPLYVLLIRRAYEPYAGRWALPGGLRDEREEFEQTARRELLEETGLVAPLDFRLVGKYDAPGRDPRGPVVSRAFVGPADPNILPTAGDDAAAAQWVPYAAVAADPDVLAFDHAQILRDALDVFGGVSQ